MDAILLDVDLACIVGILPRERVEPQPLAVSLRMELDLERVGVTGDLGQGLDYAAVDAVVRFLAVEGRFRLIESLGITVLRAVLGGGPVARATVRVRKPSVLRSAAPAIELARDRAWATGDVLADLSEVRIERRHLGQGQLASGDAVFRVGEGPVPAPFRADRPTDVIVVTRR